MNPTKNGFPYASCIVLAVVLLLCFASSLIAPGDPGRMDTGLTASAPNLEHLFGTDDFGRDIFNMVLHGGRVSLYIGALATLISTLIAIVYGSISGFSNRYTDTAMMRGSEIFLSIPSILMVIVLQAIVGAPTPTSIAVVIGLTSWMTMAKLIRSEVRQLYSSDFVLASKSMGAKLPFITRVHLIPNFLPSIMFMVIINIGTAIGTEATLSFLGVGLPLNQVSWGSIMSLSERELLTDSWWIIIFPGLFLVITIFALTNISEYIRTKNNVGYGGLA